MGSAQVARTFLAFLPIGVSTAFVAPTAWEAEPARPIVITESRIARRDYQANSPTVRTRGATATLALKKASTS